MKDIQDSLVSSQEMLDIRRRRRLYLCHSLTLIGSVFLLVFGLLSLNDRSYVLGWILLSCMLAGLFNSYWLHRTNNIGLAVRIVNVVLFVLSLTLLITGGKDDTGLLWIYPIVAINLFLNRFRQAAYLYGGFLVISGLLLFTPLSQFLLANYTTSEAVRFELTLMALWVICLAALYSEERAYDLLLQLHNDDVRKLAYFDTLTGLPNRWNFQTQLARVLQRAGNKQRVALLYIDLDNFKQVNDNYGHEVGDKLLFKFSQRLSDEVRPTDLILNTQGQGIARLAGDEFVVILPELEKPADAGHVASRILEGFKGGFEVEGVVHPVYASIGIAIYPDDANTPSELLHHADVAMYEAKRSRHNAFHFFTADLARTLNQKQRIERALKEALEDDLFSLLYMPIFHVSSRSVMAVEALLRCDHPEMHDIGPDRFIPVAEACGLIRMIDAWVLDRALQDFVTLKQMYQFGGQLCVNVSGVELQNDEFPRQVLSLLREHGVEASDLELEITETALIAESEQEMGVLKQLSRSGVSLALDDFGTGYTAFKQLLGYPADTLKIDRAFVADIFSENLARQKMVRVILDLARIYGLRVVAEGVETERQLEYLQSMGCAFVQGYLLSKPLPLSQLAGILRQKELAN